MRPVNLLHWLAPGRCRRRARRLGRLLDRLARLRRWEIEAALRGLSARQRAAFPAAVARLRLQLVLLALERGDEAAALAELEQVPARWEGHA